MGGFRNIAELVAAFDAGKTWISTFRKQVAVTATIAGQWYDFSYASGNPVANYYASAPGEAAVLSADRGIIVPQMAAGNSQYLHRTTLQMQAATATSTTTDDLYYHLCDYLLFYPFIDMDATGSDQLMDNNTASLTRYTDGVGVKMMVVSQSSTTGGGQFTITYIGSDDVQYTTPTLFCAAAQPSGALTLAVGAASGVCPFVPLNAGVNGVKRVVSVNFSVANGGLCALVLVKPLWTTVTNEGSRRTTSGTLESFGTAQEKEAPRMAAMPEIKNGAFLGFIGGGPGGSYASAVLAGTVETVWN